jgi:hypothetical protein
MERYKNLGGNSDVIAYEIENESIAVQFNDSAIYLYNYRSAGEVNIEKMKTLAVAGRGLNSFIMKQARKRYAAKLR